MVRTPIRRIRPGAASQTHTIEISETPSLWNGSDGFGQRTLGATFNGAILRPSSEVMVPAAGQVFGQILNPVPLSDLIEDLTTR